VHNPTIYKYSVLWSERIYAGLESKFGRVLTSYNAIWGISRKTPIFWLATGSRRWASYKRYLKVWASWDKNNGRVLDNPKLLNERIVLFKWQIKKWQKTL